MSSCESALQARNIAIALITLLVAFRDIRVVLLLWALRLLVEMVDLAEVVLIQPSPVRTPLATATTASIRTSPDSPYAGLVAAFRQLSERKVASGRGFLTAESLARVIVEAAQTRRSRPRYKLGAVAQAMSFLRHALSDRSWDALMGMMYRPAAAPPSDRRASA